MGWLGNSPPVSLLGPSLLAPLPLRLFGYVIQTGRKPLLADANDDRDLPFYLKLRLDLRHRWD
jgi:hypothetical protein